MALESIFKGDKSQSALSQFLRKQQLAEQQAGAKAAPQKTLNETFGTAGAKVETPKVSVSTGSTVTPDYSAIDKFYADPANSDYHYDPVLNQIKQGNATGRADNASAALAAKRKLLADLGDRGTAEATLGASDPTLSAISDDPTTSTSILARLKRAYADTVKANEDTDNKANLWYSSTRGQHLGDAARDFTTRQADAIGGARDSLADVENQLSTANKGLLSADAQAEGDAYSRWLSAFLKNPGTKTPPPGTTTSTPAATTGGGAATDGLLPKTSGPGSPGGPVLVPASPGSGPTLLDKPGGSIIGGLNVGAVETSGTRPDDRGGVRGPDAPLPGVDPSYGQGGGAGAAAPDTAPSAPRIGETAGLGGMGSSNLLAALTNAADHPNTPPVDFSQPSGPDPGQAYYDNLNPTGTTDVSPVSIATPADQAAGMRGSYQPLDENSLPQPLAAFLQPQIADAAPEAAYAPEQQPEAPAPWDPQEAQRQQQLLDYLQMMGLA